MAKSYGTFWLMRRQAEKLATLTAEIEKHLPKAWGLAVTSLPAFRDLQGLAEAQAGIYDERCVWCGEDHPDDECEDRDRFVCERCGLIEDDKAGHFGWESGRTLNGKPREHFRYCLVCMNSPKLPSMSPEELRVREYKPHHPCTRCDERAEEGSVLCPSCIHEEALREARMRGVPYPSDLHDDPAHDEVGEFPPAKGYTE